MQIRILTNFNNYSVNSLLIEKKKSEVDFNYNSIIYKTIYNI